jgi:hypothetical protein
MKRNSFIILFVIFFHLIVTACGTAPDEITPSPVETLLPTTGPAEQLDAGLDKLPSYRAWLVLKFVGEDVNGSPTTSSFVAIEEVNQAEVSTHLLARNDLNNERPGSVDIFDLPNQTYLVSSELVGQGGCQQVDAKQLPGQTDLAPRPADLFKGIYRGKLLSSDDHVGTVSALRYALDYADLSLGEAQNVQGTLWYDQNGETVLRSTGSADGRLSLGGGATYGEVNWEYLLTDIGAVSITLPPECQALIDNTFPLPNGATYLTKAGPILQFTTDLPPKDVIEFYRSTLVEQGYDIQIDSGGGSAYSLSGAKDDKHLQITITMVDGESHVEINLPSP